MEAVFVEAIGSRCEISKGMTGKEMTDFANVRGNFISDRMHLSKSGAQNFFDLKVKLKLP